MCSGVGKHSASFTCADDQVICVTCGVCMVCMLVLLCNEQYCNTLQYILYQSVYKEWESTDETDTIE